MELALSAEERDVLAELLEAQLADIRGEIRKTERLEWREDLKRREAVVRGIVARLRAGDAQIG